jgi:hypothetical protein
MRFSGWFALAGLLVLGAPTLAGAQEPDQGEVRALLVAPDTGHIVRAMERCDEASIRAVLSKDVTNGFEELEEPAANPREHVLAYWRGEPGGYRALCGVVLKALRHGLERLEAPYRGYCAPAIACRSGGVIGYEDERSALVLSPRRREDLGDVVTLCERPEARFGRNDRVCILDRGERRRIPSPEIWSEHDMLVDFGLEDGRLVITNIGQGC